MKRVLFFAFAIILLSGAALPAQTIGDGRSLGMAGSNLAITEGTEYISGNPATLAVPRSFNFEMQLLSAHAMVQNNGLSLNEYDRYFTTGDSLTSGDIDDLLGHIPDKGLRADFLLGLKTFSFYAHPFSLSITGMGNGYVNLPKAPFELPFYGNVNSREYSLDDLKGEGWAGAAVNFGIAFPIKALTSDRINFVSVGIAPKYIIGLQYANIQKATGQLLTTDDFIVANGYMETLRSEGGSGFGLDLGVLAEYQKDWTLGLHFTNLAGSVRWNKNNEIKVFEFQSDTLRLNSPDSMNTVEHDTSVAAGSFTTALPRAFSFSAAYRMKSNLLLTAAYRQGLNHALGNFTKPRLSFGAEYKPFSVFPLRIGTAFGGNNGFALGLGSGIDLKYWQLNIGYLNHNFRWFRSSRSIELAVTTQFRF
ncbi:MAG: DUF5723 family protein [Calditrichia bacterium]